jgi:hypothetical protein
LPTPAFAHAKGKDSVVFSVDYSVVIWLFHWFQLVPGGFKGGWLFEGLKV